MLTPLDLSRPLLIFCGTSTQHKDRNNSFELHSIFVPQYIQLPDACGWTMSRRCASSIILTLYRTIRECHNKVNIDAVIVQARLTQINTLPSSSGCSRSFVYLFCLLLFRSRRRGDAMSIRYVCIFVGAKRWTTCAPYQIYAHHHIISQRQHTSSSRRRSLLIKRNYKFNTTKFMNLFVFVTFCKSSGHLQWIIIWRCLIQWRIKCRLHFI